MAFNRRESRSSRTDLTFDPLEPPPPIAALFLIRFDIKAGYTIAWKRSLPGIELENVVEFKSLPSGLHNVKEDLVYFVHEQYAGVSAFINQPAAESERNALMLAAGVLVPLSHGRLGKNWRHAPGLKELVWTLADNQDDTSPLSQYWDHFEVSDLDSHSRPESPLDSIPGRRSRQEPHEEFRRSRALSDATALGSYSHVLAPYHPAASSPELIHDFGPLIFPLYRAALLRKRILLIGDAPVELACNFVYNLSLLSSIPHNLLPLLPPKAHAMLRPMPLFNVGIHDMSHLSSLPRDSSSGESCWIACTSDRVFSMKQDLYDVLVQLPAPFSKHAAEKVYPTVTFPTPSRPGTKQPKPTPIKATQRDARRYLHLRNGLSEFSRADPASAVEKDDSDASSTFSSTSIVEPLSWPLLAYTSFIWWASAGETSSESSGGEAEQDSRLLLADEDGYLMQPNNASRRSSTILPERANKPQEVALVTYFRRLTTQIFTVLSDVVNRHDRGDVNDADSEPDTSSNPPDEYFDDEDDETTALHSSSLAAEPSEPLLTGSSDQDEDEIVYIKTSDVTDMGLDPWSDVDKAFVEALCALWFQRKAQVHGARIRCCGVQIL